MSILLNHIFDSGLYYCLAGLISAAIYFAMLGIRYLKAEQYEGLTFLAVSLFFVAANFLFLLSGSGNDIMSTIKIDLTLMTWIISIVGPAVIILYFILSLYSLFRLRLSEAILKTLLGVTLIIFLFSIGGLFPDLAKAGLVIIAGYIWFRLELDDSAEIC